MRRSAALRLEGDAFCEKGEIQTDTKSLIYYIIYKGSPSVDIKIWQKTSNFREVNELHLSRCSIVTYVFNNKIDERQRLPQQNFNSEREDWQNAVKYSALRVNDSASLPI